MLLPGVELRRTENKEKHPDEACVRKAPEKAPAIAIEREQETVMETKHDFVNPSTAVVPTQQHQ